VDRALGTNSRALVVSDRRRNGAQDFGFGDPDAAGAEGGAAVALGAAAGDDDGAADALGDPEAAGEPYGFGVGATGVSACSGGKPCCKRRRAKCASFDDGNVFAT
jgi:hypothetical protein